MTSCGNSFYDFLENQLTIFCALPRILGLAALAGVWLTGLSR